MKRKYRIVILLFCTALLLTSCSTGKHVPRDKAQDALAYMESKYGQPFEIVKIGYKRQSTKDPVIPMPDFLEQYSEDIRAEMAAKNGHSSQDTIIVDYNASSGKFSDNYQEDEIKKILYDYGFLNNILQIDEVVSYEWDVDQMHIKYPQDMEGFYNLNAFQPVYVTQYLKEHEVSIGNNNVAAAIACDEADAEEVLKKLDYIFLEVFRSKDTYVQIKFYSKEQRSILENQDGQTETSITPYMWVTYIEGQRRYD